MFVITNPVIGSLGVAGETGGPLTTLLATTLRMLFIVAGLIFVFFFITGGLNWITAEGKPDKLEKARNQIINALTGLIVVAAVVAITSFIGNALNIEFLKTLNFSIENVAPAPQTGSSTLNSGGSNNGGSSQTCAAGTQIGACAIGQGGVKYRCYGPGTGCNSYSYPIYCEDSSCP